jgi:hypothetical protein
MYDSTHKKKEAVKTGVELAENVFRVVISPEESNVKSITFKMGNSAENDQKQVKSMIKELF